MMFELPIRPRTTTVISEPLDVLAWLLTLFGVLASPSLQIMGERAYLDWRRLLWWRR